MTISSKGLRLASQGPRTTLYMLALSLSLLKCRRVKVHTWSSYSFRYTPLFRLNFVMIWLFAELQAAPNKKKEKEEED